MADVNEVYSAVLADPTHVTLRFLKWLTFGEFVESLKNNFTDKCVIFTDPDTSKTIIQILDSGLFTSGRHFLRRNNFIQQNITERLKKKENHKYSVRLLSRNGLHENVN